VGNRVTGDRRWNGFTHRDHSVWWEQGGCNSFCATELEIRDGRIRQIEIHTVGGE
jgi:hypothetical protein